MFRSLPSALLACLMAAAFLPAQAQSGPNDAQIAAIVVVANQVDVDAGKLAQDRTKSEEVRKFAKQMVVDHNGVNEAATALVTKLKVNGFIATLGTGLIIKGYLDTFYKGSAGSVPPEFQYIGATGIGPVPIPTIIMLALAVVGLLGQGGIDRDQDQVMILTAEDMIVFQVFLVDEA